MNANNGKPEIVIGVKPAPLDLVLNEEWHAESVRLVKLHSAAPALLEQLIRLKEWHRILTGPDDEIAQLVQKLAQDAIDEVTK
jgi:hypothetical protein